MKKILFCLFAVSGCTEDSIETGAVEQEVTTMCRQPATLEDCTFGQPGQVDICRGICNDPCLSRNPISGCTSTYGPGPVFKSNGDPICKCFTATP